MQADEAPETQQTTVPVLRLPSKNGAQDNNRLVSRHEDEDKAVQRKGFLLVLSLAGEAFHSPSNKQLNLLNASHGPVTMLRGAWEYFFKHIK